MDYEKKYKDVLSKAKDMLSYKEVRQEDMEYLFPELAESEDERIRKALIDFFNRGAYNGEQTNGVYDKDILAWLEKQGESKQTWSEEDEHRAKDTIYFLDTAKKHYASSVELDACIAWIKSLKERVQVINKPFDYENINIQQMDFAPKSAMEAIKEEKVNNQNCVKSTNKVKPKFHEGTWIVWQDKYYKVNYNGCGYELVDQNGLSTSLEYGTVDKNAHLWTIKDAKDGDVLAAKGSYFKEYVFMYSSLTEDNVISSHFGYDVFHGNFDTKLTRFGREEDFLSVTPATKEQRELLFKRMKEWGYEWDAEKKGLFKIFTH